MRPVNLIPAEERRGERTPMRGGPLAYVLVAALVLALAGVTLLVVTNNQISEHKAEITSLEQQNSVAQAHAAQLSPYIQFHSVYEQRVATVTSLAESRFDWERVMRELALILPGDVWLTSLGGTATPEVTVAGAPGISLRDGIPGPALEMVGCARGQEAVAGFVDALKDIDGVTRVGMQSSMLGSASGDTSGGDTAGGSVAASGTCQTRRFIAQFQIVVAFDAAPVIPPATSGG
jgi:Tfp pilus assembly protein PilN